MPDERSLDNELNALTKQHGLDDGVRFVRQPPYPELLGYLKYAGCIVIPSRNESIPLVFGEALQAGTPLIVSDVGAGNVVRNHLHSKCAARSRRVFDFIARDERGRRGGVESVRTPVGVHRHRLCGGGELQRNVKHGMRARCCNDCLRCGGEPRRLDI